MTDCVAACPQAPTALVQWLYDTYAGPLVAYVTRLTSDPHGAEDVVQEAMLRAWQHADTLSPDRGSMWGWLTRVARNIAIDRSRARLARPTEVAESVVSVEASRTSDHAEDVATSLAMADALRRLSPAHREVLYEVYYLDRTAAAAADVLGIPVGTVKSRLYHAVRQLRHAMEQEPAGQHHTVPECTTVASGVPRREAAQARPRSTRTAPAAAAQVRPAPKAGKTRLGAAPEAVARAAGFPGSVPGVVWWPERLVGGGGDQLIDAGSGAGRSDRRRMDGRVPR